MKVYRVGGSVRDELLGRPVADRDWVVVGATPEAMAAEGYLPVGRDFPVFLHPTTREEYALARTERKSGRGYRGFVFVAAPEVTLEQDLARRDLTINAMARAADGTLIDPFGGQRDLRAGVLRHVSPAFAEDPLRVLRVARFAARFGFGVDPETMTLMRSLAAGGELDELSVERVWQELARGLMESHPSRMLDVLRDCGALAQVLPEVDAAYAVSSVGPAKSPPPLLARALDDAARRGLPLPVRYAILAHGLGEGRGSAPTGSTAAASCDSLRRRGTEVARNVRLADRMSARLKAPVECRDAARLAARWCRVVDQAPNLRAARLLDLLGASDALRRPERLETLLAASEVVAMASSAGTTGLVGTRGGKSIDVAGAPTVDPVYPPAGIIRAALAVVRGVQVAAVAREARRRPRTDGDAIAAAIRAARLAALRVWRRTDPGGASACAAPRQTR